MAKAGVGMAASGTAVGGVPIPVPTPALAPVTAEIVATTGITASQLD